MRLPLHKRISWLAMHILTSSSEIALNRVIGARRRPLVQRRCNTTPLDWQATRPPDKRKTHGFRRGTSPLVFARMLDTMAVRRATKR